MFRIVGDLVGVENVLVATVEFTGNGEPVDNPFDGSGIIDDGVVESLGRISGNAVEQSVKVSAELSRHGICLILSNFFNCGNTMCNICSDCRSWQYNKASCRIYTFCSPIFVCFSLEEDQELIVLFVIIRDDVAPLFKILDGSPLFFKELRAWNLGSAASTSSSVTHLYLRLRNEFVLPKINWTVLTARLLGQVVGDV